jgi:DNA-binding response OmpR family regulator
LKKLNFLLVDDTRLIVELNIDMINEFFKDYKFSFTTAHSFEDFMNKNHDERYDFSIIDWNLGRTSSENGDQVIKYLRGKDLSENTVIYSGMSDDSIVISEFCLLNSCAYISKSSPSRLVEYIADRLGIPISEITNKANHEKKFPIFS